MTHPNFRDRVLRLPEVKAITGLGRTTIYDAIRQGRFPNHILLEGRSVGWLESEVMQWLSDRVSTSRK